MSKAGDYVVDKAEKIDDIARMRYIQWVAKELDIDIESAAVECIEGADPAITLGYKLTPTWQMGIWGPGMKSRKSRIIAKFEEYLTPDEIELFRREVLPKENGGRFRRSLMRRQSDKND